MPHINVLYFYSTYQTIMWVPVSPAKMSPSQHPAKLGSSSLRATAELRAAQGRPRSQQQPCELNLVLWASPPCLPGCLLPQSHIQVLSPSDNRQQTQRGSSFVSLGK